MTLSTARLTVLRLIGDHEGEWSWYQFARAFPPGWFADEPPDTRAIDILHGLEADGLVTKTPGGPQPKYRLTDRGADVLRGAGVGSTSA